MADPMSIASVGLGAGNLVNSAIKGNQAAQETDQQFNAQEQMIGEIFSGAGEDLNRIRTANDQFTNTGLQTQLLGMAQQAGRDVTSNNLDAAGNLQGPGLFQNAQNALSGSGVLDSLQDLGGLGNVNAQGAFGQSLNALGGLNDLGSIRDQALDFATQAGDRARSTALEQSALAFGQGEDALNEQLAARGISGDSGVAAQALGDMALQGAQQRSQLERSLADQAQQAALGGAQFDIQNRLAENQLTGGLASDIAGLGVQAGLGQNQLLGNLAQGQAQHDLGVAQGLSGIQQGMDQRTLQAAHLQNQAALQPLDLMQQQYTQNYLTPQLQTMSMLNPMGAIQSALAGQGSLTEAAGTAASEAGSGKGAASGLMGAGLQGLSGGKGAGSGSTPYQHGGWFA